MYALRQHAQHLCPRVLTPACPGFLTVADLKGNVGATRAREHVAQGSLSSLAAIPPRRAFDGAAHSNSDYPVCGAARSRTAGRAAGPECGPCATTRVAHTLLFMYALRRKKMQVLSF